MPYPDAEGVNAVPRVVLDSNVWIDILVFDDPATRPILAALERGDLSAMIDSRCLNELARVLDYPQFVARAVDKSAALAAVTRLAALEPSRAAPGDGAPLPKCRDRDDQKFLELAQAVKADWLVSKDRALLKLNKRTSRDFGFRISEPAPFAAALALLGDAKAG
ncbi:putative toxin-antitoxin system toxin component, PIN family [Trinickia dabaoshanensis]|uniref:Putative toxin-antitoxin system toxin component, PIN family n=1 Tax=Trinickia dabaoshanensis TaxID=564714 RepID=A0A2N7VNL3_9BURK|nr:putative toxin-antitoxin system toxin component, PIN family [Trinickia dabaoshanensis]PMS18730.1 putative toxin-antitoxin system toxin component, PIN family [Trinickia dabaoshanensis]